MKRDDSDMMGCVYAGPPLPDVRFIPQNPDMLQSQPSMLMTYAGPDMQRAIPKKCCVVCGAINSERANFCTECGAPLFKDEDKK